MSRESEDASKVTSLTLGVAKAAMELSACRLRWSILGQNLIMMDVYSKWLEVLPVVNATSHTTIEKPHSLFAIIGVGQ